LWCNQINKSSKGVRQNDPEKWATRQAHQPVNIMDQSIFVLFFSGKMLVG